MADKTSTQRIVLHLRGNLGRTLVAYIAGTRSEKDVQRWINGATPDSAQYKRLKFAYDLLTAVASSESMGVAKAWLIGSSIDGGESSPAEAIRNGRFKAARTSSEQMIRDDWM